MKKSILLILVLALLAWSIYAAFLLGGLPRNWIPAQLAALKRPNTTEALGSSLGAIESLLGTLTIALGLWAVLIQGKELTETVRANERAQALTFLTYLASALDRRIDEYEDIIAGKHERREDWTYVAAKVNEQLKPTRDRIHAEAIRQFWRWNRDVKLPEDLEEVLKIRRPKPAGSDGNAV
jgi:hypothetical protein